MPAPLSMKPKINQLTKISAPIAGLLLIAGASQAATISVLASGGRTSVGTDATVFTTTNAGAGAEMLVVSAHYEIGGTLNSVFYGTQQMTLIATTASGNSRAQGIYTLVNPAATGNITLNFSSVTSGTKGIAFASLSSSDGEAIAVGASGFANGTTLVEPTLSLGIPENDSFVFIAAGSNDPADAVISSTHLPTQMDIGTIPSMGADARFANGVASGTSPTYMFTSSNNDAGNVASIIGASFHVVPEPSAALLGSFGLLALLRRRRA